MGQNPPPLEVADVQLGSNPHPNVINYELRIFKLMLAIIQSLATPARSPLPAL
jgi:hypothetical protein